MSRSYYSKSFLCILCIGWLMSVTVLAAESDNEPKQAEKHVVVKVTNPKLNDDIQPFTPITIGTIFKVEKEEGDLITVQEGSIRKADVIPFDEAETYFTDQITKDPSADNYYHRSLFWFASKEFSKAVDDATQAIRQQPAVDYYVTRGNAYVILKKTRSALRDFEQAIKLEPRHAEAYLGRALLNRRSGRTDEMLADFDQALQLNPKLANAYFERGRHWAEKKKTIKPLATFRPRSR